MANVLKNSAICAVFMAGLISQSHATDYSDDLFAKTFRSPSGKIVCMGDSKDRSSNYLVNGVSCLNFNPVSPSTAKPQPEDCGLDWTPSMNVNRTGKAENSGECHGDVFWNPEAKVLPYGETITGKGWQCKSQTTGITCSNSADHGFLMNKKVQKIW